MLSVLPLVLVAVDPCPPPLCASLSARVGAALLSITTPNTSTSSTAARHAPLTCADRGGRWLFRFQLRSSFKNVIFREYTRFFYPPPFFFNSEVFARELMRVTIDDFFFFPPPPPPSPFPSLPFRGPHRTTRGERSCAVSVISDTVTDGHATTSSTRTRTVRSGCTVHREGGRAKSELQHRNNQGMITVRNECI